MIIIYHEDHSGALQTVDGHRLNCKATWNEINAKNLRAAIGAIAHAPSEWTSGGEIQVEVDGVLVAVERLPKYGSADLLRRCSSWLDDLRRSQARPAAGPVFGL